MVLMAKLIKTFYCICDKSIHVRVSHKSIPPLPPAKSLQNHFMSDKLKESNANESEIASKPPEFRMKAQASMKAQTA